MPQPPTLNYDAVNGKIYWDDIPGATNYKIVCKKDGESVWDDVYIGSERDCPFADPPYSGTYDLKGKSQGNEEWGDFSPEITVTI